MTTASLLRQSAIGAPDAATQRQYNRLTCATPVEHFELHAIVNGDEVHTMRRRVLPRRRCLYARDRGDQREE